MCSQLEVMMSAVRHESATLNSMKEKLKELDTLKLQVPKIERQVRDLKKENFDVTNEKLELEKANIQLRLDMQRLNDLYNTERKQHLEVQHTQLRQEQELLVATKDVGRLQKIVDESTEVYKKNKELNREVGLLQQRLDEEKRALAKSFQSLEKQVEETEKVKGELSQHFWNLSEELKTSNQRLAESELIRSRLENAMGQINDAFNQSLEGTHMAIEDSLSLRLEMDTRTSSKSVEQQRELATLRARVQELQNCVADLQATQSDMEKHAELMRKDNSAILSSHADQMQALSEKNKELLATEVRLCHKIEAMDRASQNMETLRGQQKTEMDRLEGLIAALEKRVKSVSDERDAALLKAESSSTHTTALETQLKEAHAKQWADIQNLKERELKAEMDVQELEDAVEEKESRIRELEGEKRKLEEMCQDEIAKVSHMSGVLKAELEKRLDELSGCVRERDGLKMENGKLKEAVENQLGDMKKREKIFQHAIDTDRAKIQQELKAKNNRIRNLESEKQELLSETSHLMEQLAMEQKAKSNIDKNVGKINESLTAAHEDLKNCRIDNNRLDRELQATMKRERELQDRLSDMESQFKMDIARLDSIVKESRKTAAQQVGELSSKCQTLTDELNEERKRMTDLETSERQAVLNAEKWNTELKMLRTEHEDFQMTAGKEIAAAKREAQNTHGKVKTLADIKAKMDMELVSLRMERARAGSDVTQLADKIKTLEDRNSSLETELANTADELEKMTAASRRNKASAIDMEANMQRHVKMLAKATEEIERLERHSFMEGKKLRTNLSNATRKLQENSETIAKLTAEVENGTSQFAKLQSSTNDTISGLMEELKRTEDALSKERHTNSTESSKMHSKISTLQSQLELTKDSMNEKLIQTESDRSDKQMMLMQLNSEAGRLKKLNEGKDKRIEELEKQHQDDRLKMQELRSKLTAMESELSDVRVELAKTDKQKRALDVKYQNQLTANSPTKKYEDTWSACNALAAGGDGEHGEPDFDSKNRIYLADDEEYVGRKYGNSMYGEDDGDGGAGGGYRSSFDPYQAIGEVARGGAEDGEEYHGHYSIAPVAALEASPINSSRNGPGGEDEDDYVDEESFRRAIAAAGTNVPTYGRAPPPSQQQPDFEVEGDSDDVEGNDVAASIARTQRFLQKRGKGGNKSGGGDVGAALAERKAAGDARKKPKSRGGQRRAGAFESDGGRQVSGATYLHDSNDEGGDGNDFNFESPSLMPATPPMYGHSSLTYDIGEDDDEGGIGVPLSRESSRSLPVEGGEEAFPGSSHSSRSGVKSRGSSTGTGRKVKSSEASTKRRRGAEDKEKTEGEVLFPKISPLRKASGKR
jgi:chromosome segregation ATPase